MNCLRFIRDRPITQFTLLTIFLVTLVTSNNIGEPALGTCLEALKPEQLISEICDLYNQPRIFDADGGGD